MRYLHLLGDLLGTRFASKPLHQQPGDAQQFVDRLDHVHRNADGAALVGDRSRHRLPNPPGRVSRELESALVFELIDRAHQADIPFLNQIQKAQAAIGVALGQADDEPQIRLGQLLPGLAALILP